mgnify:CR=1 FL=1
MKKTTLFFVSALILLIVLFAFDFFTPQGFAHGTLYLAPLLLAWKSRSSRCLIFVTLAALVFTLLGLIIHAPNYSEPHFFYPLAEHAVTMILLAAFAFFLHRKMKQEAWHLLQKEAMDAASSGFLIVNRVGTVEYGNPAFSRFCRQLKNDVAGMNIDLIPCLENKETIQRVMVEGRAWDGEVSCCNETCHRRFARLSIRPIHESDRHDQHAVLIFDDITHLKDLQTQLQDTQQEMETLLDTLTIGIISLDNRLHFEFINRMAEQLLQKNNEEVRGRLIWEAFPEGRGSRFEECYRQALETQQPVELTEYYAPLKTWFYVKAIPTPSGLAIFFYDVTREQESLRALEASEQAYRNQSRLLSAVLDGLDEGILVLNRWAQVTLVNNYAVRFFSDQLKDMPIEQWPERLGIYLEDQQSIYETVNLPPLRALSGEFVQKQQIYIRNAWMPQGAHLLFSARPLRDDQQEVIGSVSWFRDISRELEIEEREKQIENSLRQSQKMEAIGKLTGGVAHDFNNLLTVIMGNASLLTMKLEENSKPYQLTQMIQTAAERGSLLTQRLLAFSRKQPLRPGSTQINQLIEGMYRLLTRTLGENIEIEFKPADDLWLALIDSAQLETAILNLALNARDAMPGGGQLTIETANTQLDERHAAMHDELAPGEYVMVAISDTGLGMKADVMEQAFEPFFTTKKVGKGSGLGLSMVYGFVKQSKGHIKIYSEPDQGTTIRLYFPKDAGEDEDTSQETASLQETPRGHGERVLVVEDDEMVRHYTSEALVQLNYQIYEAAQAQEALQRLAEHSIDLLFTDIVMPGGMNGKELADEARKRNPGIRVLFTSGYTENAIIHHGRLDSDVYLLSKPFSKEELAHKVRLALNQSSS